MIDTKKIEELVNQRISESDLFIVEIIVNNSNDIRVLIDSPEGVRINDCTDLSRWLSKELGGLIDNFSLEVSSPGVGSPLKKRQQYDKNIGRDVEIILADSTKKKGKLTGVSDQGITCEILEKMVQEGGSQKKKKDVLVEHSYSFVEIKTVKVLINI